jgi:hypothetical protein
VGGVTPPLGLLAVRHTAQTHGEAGVTKAAPNQEVTQHDAKVMP